jgi:glutamate synthase (NADPH/NADH) small chain
MDFLQKNTKSLLDSNHADREFIDAKGKNVIVIGGGDTGTDCIATAVRHGCRSIVQFEIMTPPPEKIYTHENWLARTRFFQVDYGQEEAREVFGSDPREYCIMTKKFVGDEKGNLKGLETVGIEWKQGKASEIAGTEKFWEADKVFLAMGFTGIEKLKMFEDLGVSLTSKGTISVDENKQTSAPKIFAAGDCERGQSLVVWAIADGRRAANGVDNFLRSAGKN